jgi:hypothetical protein
VPENADTATLKILDSLHANVVRCPRLATDKPGDPCVYRFREAIEQGCVPFGVQGPENAWCLDGGRTIGWEMAVVAEDLSGSLISRMFVQVEEHLFHVPRADFLPVLPSHEFTQCKRKVVRHWLVHFKLLELMAAHEMLVRDGRSACGLGRQRPFLLPTEFSTTKHTTGSVHAMQWPIAMGIQWLLLKNKFTRVSRLRSV